MTRFSWIGRLLLLLAVGLLGSAPVSRQDGKDALAVLFVGNSYVYFNNLPGMIEGISEGLDGPKVTAGSHTHPGHRLREHLEDGHLPDAIGERPGGLHWDVVVLQEQSKLATAMDPLTGELGAPVAAVGAAWAVASHERPDLALFLADGSHPNPAGSYLAACVLYATLTGKSPVGAPREVWGAPWNGRGPVESDTSTLLVSLSPRDAAFLQELAWRTVSQQDPQHR